MALVHFRVQENQKDTPWRTANKFVIKEVAQETLAMNGEEKYPTRSYKHKLAIIQFALRIHSIC